MSKTVTLRMDEKLYRKFRALAKKDNRSLSNFIQHAAQRFAESVEYADDAEMAEIRANKELGASIERGLADARAGRGRFV